MLKIFVSYMLGNYGLKLLNFYFENSAVINSVIFIYGIFLVMCHMNYKKIMDAVYLSLKNGQKKVTIKKIDKINWEKFISENTSLPFIAGNYNFFPRKLNLHNFEKIRTKDKKWRNFTKSMIS